MEQLRKYYVLAVAALNFAICAIAFFIWTRIVVMAQVDDKCIFVLISAFVSFIMCSIYATIANKKGVIPEKKRNSLSIITMLLSIIMVILASSQLMLYRKHQKERKNFMFRRYFQIMQFTMSAKKE
ncbi:hypothetical protein [uncultured Campylobacter sp.]|uniref:hypothetical protein n=1 Tax=uncultured Campylobacter sp. TaxID=218934 RepID=UPI00262E2ACC|nr:hypothetical protein [uncultured Campylobacter sp.]